MKYHNHNNHALECVERTRFSAWKGKKMADYSLSRVDERVADPSSRWYFSKDDLRNSPSRAHGVDPAKELNYRQHAANLIQDMGNRLGLNQLCTATAIVYMHRFYMVHSFKAFHRVNVSTAALFLAAKVEEQPRKLEHMAKVFHSLHNREGSDLDVGSPEYAKIIEDITYHELLILETLGFEVQVEHPHQHVVKCTRLVRASKDLSQTAYFMTHNSLLLTTFCLEHRPTVVACVCIHLAATWKGEDFTNLSSQKSNWWEYVDPSVTLEQLNELTKEFLMIYERCPSRLQKKITEPMKSQHYKQKPGSSSSSSSTSSSSTSSSSSHHHLHHPPSLSSQSSSNQPDQSKPTVKHKPPHTAKDQGQSSSSQGRTHPSSHTHAHAHGQQQPQPSHGGKQLPSSGKGQMTQQVPPGHKPHHSHNHPPHPHQSKSGMMVGASLSQSQHLPHAKLVVSASMSSTKPHHAHYTDGKHHVMSGMPAGASNKYSHQSQSGIHGAKSGNELSNSLGGGSSGHLLPHMKHQRPQGGGMHGNPNSDPLKHRHHHKLHARVSDPHLNHSYDQQKGIKRPYSEENFDRKRLKLEPSLGLPSLPPLPPLPADPPPPPPPSSFASGTGMGVSTNATLPPLPLMGSEPPALPPLPPPLPLSNPDESPPPPPPPPNH